MVARELRSTERAGGLVAESLLRRRSAEAAWVGVLLRRVERDGCGHFWRTAACSHFVCCSC
jgi:hypothetical protein